MDGRPINGKQTQSKNDSASWKSRDCKTNITIFGADSRAHCKTVWLSNLWAGWSRSSIQTDSIHTITPSHRSDCRPHGNYAGLSSDRAEPIRITTLGIQNDRRIPSWTTNQSDHTSSWAISRAIRNKITLSILHWNMGSTFWANKTAEIKLLVNEKDPDIVMISEANIF